MAMRKAANVLGIIIGPGVMPLQSSPPLLRAEARAQVLRHREVPQRGPAGGRPARRADAPLGRRLGCLQPVPHPRHAGHQLPGTVEGRRGRRRRVGVGDDWSAGGHLQGGPRPRHRALLLPAAPGPVRHQLAVQRVRALLRLARVGDGSLRLAPQVLDRGWPRYVRRPRPPRPAPRPPLACGIGGPWPALPSPPPPPKSRRAPPGAPGTRRPRRPASPRWPGAADAAAPPGGAEPPARF